MVDFMSQRDFESGGPTPSAVGSAGQGFGQLAQVLAQGPRIRASAAQTAAETDKTRAETAGLTADQATKADIIARQREIMTLASDPNTAKNPAARQRLLALGANDPLISPHLNSILAANFGLAAMNGLLTARERDAYSGATGVAPYGNTETGQAASLANTLADTRLKETGATTRTGMTIAGENYRQGQTAVTGRPQGAGPDTAPVIMPQSRAYETPGGITPVSPTQQDREGTPVAVVPAGSAPGTVPTQVPGGVVAAKPGAYTTISPQQQQDAQAPVQVVITGSPAGTQPFVITKGELAANPGKYTEISPAQQAAEAAPTTVLRDGRARLQGTGAATAAGAEPVATSPEGAWTPQYQSELGAALSGNRGGISGQGPVSLDPAAAPPAGSTPVPNAPQLDENGQPIPGSRLATVLANRPPPATTVVPPKSDAQEGLDMNALLDTTGKKHYPAGTGLTGGMAGELGPKARAVIMARTAELMRTGAFRQNAGGAMERAVQELQASGRLPPPGEQSASWGRSTGLVGKNVIELIEPEGDTKTDDGTTPKDPNAKPPPTTPTTPKPTSTKPAVAKMDTDQPAHDFGGRQIGKFGGKWFFIGPDGGPAEPVPASAWGRS